jgi:sulfur carrier protein
MKITLNNREEVIRNGKEITVQDLLRLKNFTFPLIIVKINGELIRRDEYPESLIRDGDKVTALHLISGG